MIKLYETFIGGNKVNLKDYIKKIDDVFKIPKVNFEFFGENYLNNEIKNTQYYIQIKYNSLMRFFIYMKLLRYDGDSPIIKSYVEGLKNKIKTKVEIINKIPNNNSVLAMINHNFGLGYPNYSYDNLQDLKKLIFQQEAILSDRNLIEYIDMIYENSKAASKIEKIVKGVINMLYSKYYEVTYAKLSEDLKGMDLWKISKKTGVRQSLQVKNITGNVKFVVKDDMIYINNTNLDLHKYESWKDPRLAYDYLIFYLEKDKKICVLNAKAILKIDKIVEKRTISIKLKNWAMEPDVNKNILRFVEVPQKFIGQDVSQIFYTTETESEIQQQNPDIAETP
jgi:hypothetical protein